MHQYWHLGSVSDAIEAADGYHIGFADTPVWAAKIIEEHNKIVEDLCRRLAQDQNQTSAKPNLTCSGSSMQ